MQAILLEQLTNSNAHIKQLFIIKEKVKYTHKVYILLEGRANKNYSQRQSPIFLIIYKYNAEGIKKNFKKSKNLINKLLYKHANIKVAKIVNTISNNKDYLNKVGSKENGKNNYNFISVNIYNTIFIYN